MVVNKFLIIAFILVSLFAAVVGSGVADGNDPYADEVYSFTQGYVWDTTKSEPPGTWGWTNAPEVTLGGPTEAAGDGNAYFISLGSRPAGEIILKFVDYVLVDGQENSGYDLAIHEFGAADDAHVYLANDRNEDGHPDDWVYLGYTKTDASLSRQVGSHPDYITGQSSSSLFLFDVVGKLDAIGGWASFIRILDDDKGRKDPNFTDGFDLNAVELLSYTTLDEVNNPEEEENPPEEEEPNGDCQGPCTDYQSCNQNSYSCKTCNKYKEIKYSKIHYKHYDDNDSSYDDDEVWVWGKVHLKTPDCGCCWDEVTVTVGSVTETVMINDKDKKRDKWEYERPKHEKGNMIKKIQIDWKKEKFDIYIDKTCIYSSSVPPVIMVSGEECAYYQGDLSKEKNGHWWGYDFSKSFNNLWNWDL